MSITIENIIKEEFSVNGVKIIPINNHKYIFISKMDFNSLKIKTINIQNLIMLYLNIKVSAVLIKRIESVKGLKESFKRLRKFLV